MKTKKYMFIYYDKQKNELHKETYEFDNIKEARQIAKDIYFNSMLNDLHKIKVIKLN